MRGTGAEKFKRKTFLGGKNVQNSTTVHNAGTRSAFETVQRRIIMSRIVVKQRQPSTAGRQRHVGRIFKCAVTPTDLGRIFLIGVLCVMDDQIRTL